MSAIVNIYQKTLAHNAHCTAKAMHTRPSDSQYANSFYIILSVSTYTIRNQPLLKTETSTTLKNSQQILLISNETIDFIFHRRGLATSSIPFVAPQMTLPIVCSCENAKLDWVIHPTGTMALQQPLIMVTVDLMYHVLTQLSQDVVKLINRHPQSRKLNRNQSSRPHHRRRWPHVVTNAYTMSIV